ncbi:MAG: hypothetical protein FJ189_03415 [Gammaproteobacteria bacterium]|nr:hypothetical protein [Gammaproteobacteria bacterium]
MKIMLDLSPEGIRDRIERFRVDFWQLRTPLTKYALAGCVYGLDNGCFGGSLPRAWHRLIDDARQVRPLWVTLPDVVGDARRTMELFEHFEMTVHGLPKALVIQDGIDGISIPWDRIDAVFIGGTDAFKQGPSAKAVATAARILKKWVHVGRVNTPSRALYWRGLADSVDGSGISRYDHMLRDLLRGINGDTGQQCLF